MKIKDWSRLHPYQSAARLIFLFFVIALGGGLFAFLVWGPLNAPLWLVVLAGLIGGSLHALLWIRQMVLSIHGKKQAARRWKYALVSTGIAIMLGMAALMLIPLYQMGYFPPASSDRVTNFERLWRAVDLAYPYFEQKEVNWQGVHDRYLPRIQSASSSQEYFQAISEMLAELKDGHTNLQNPYIGASCCFGTTRQIEGQPVVVSPGKFARQAGIKPGAVLITVNGQPAVDLVGTYRSPRGASSAQQAQYLAFLHLLDIPESLVLPVTFQNPGAQPQDVQLVYVQEKYDTGPRPSVTWEKLPSGIGRINLTRFWTEDDDVAADFGHALDELMDTPGIIIDVRENGGGDSRLADAIAGRFLEHTFVYGTEVHRLRLPMFGFKQQFDYLVKPVGPRYTGKLAVLIDVGCASTTEQFILALSESGRARTFGRTTAGTSGNPIIFQLPEGGAARFSTGAFYRLDGTLLEGKGIEPDVPVRWTISDVSEERDPDLLAAEAWLMGR